MICSVSPASHSIASANSVKAFTFWWSRNLQNSFIVYLSLSVPNLVSQKPFCYLNFISVAKPQKFGNETYDAHILASSKTYRKQNKPKKWIPNH